MIKTKDAVWKSQEEASLLFEYENTFKYLFKRKENSLQWHCWKSLGEHKVMLACITAIWRGQQNFKSYKNHRAKMIILSFTGAHTSSFKNYLMQFQVFGVLKSVRLSVRLEYKAHTRHEYMGEKKLISFAYYQNKQCIFKHTRQINQKGKKLTGVCPLIWSEFLFWFPCQKETNPQNTDLYPHSYLDLAKSTLYTDCSSAVSFNWCNCVLRWGRETWSENSQDQMYVVQKS